MDEAMFHMKQFVVAGSSPAISQRLTIGTVTISYQIITQRPLKGEKEMATMITRTVVGTKITAKVVSRVTDEVSMFSAVISKSVDTEKDATKQLAKVLPDDLVIIRIDGFEKVEKLYGMTVENFMAGAIELDPTTRKPLPTPVESEN